MHRRAHRVFQVCRETPRGLLLFPGNRLTGVFSVGFKLKTLTRGHSSPANLNQLKRRDATKRCDLEISSAKYERVSACRLQNWRSPAIRFSSFFVPIGVLFSNRWRSVRLGKLDFRKNDESGYARRTITGTGQKRAVKFAFQSESKQHLSIVFLIGMNIQNVIRTARTTTTFSFFLQPLPSFLITLSPVIRLMRCSYNNHHSFCY